MARLLASMTPVVALTLLAACTRTDDDVSSAEAAQTSPFEPYPEEVRPGMKRLDPFDPQSALVADFGSQARDQGAIASCASFGFLGLIENQMFNARGISPDLSERFMIFSNFFQTGSLGGEPQIIPRFPELVANLGLMTEEVYPYAEINDNAHRFDQDAAQGLQTDDTIETVDSAIEGTQNYSQARAAVLQRPEFLGALPKGPYPITLPAKARLQPGARVPEIEFEGKLYSCFAEGGPESVPPSKRLAVTPREFVKMCFDLDPKWYFSCEFNLGATAQQLEAELKIEDECESVSQVIDRLAVSMLERNRASLKLTLALLDQGDAVFMALNVPAPPANLLAVWSTRRFQQGGGHAVLAVGYVTYDELADPAEQNRGFLKDGIFDKLAAAVEPAYAEKLQQGLPSDPVALRDVRVSSVLGERLKTEGGLVLFRNSWGTSIQGHPVGVDGHQAMTFDFFLKNGMMILGRTQKRLPGVAWQPEAGPVYCPSTIALPHGGAWLNGDLVDGIRTHLRSQFLPDECKQ